MAESPGSRSTAVIDVSGLGFATEKYVIESRLGRQPGVVDIDANPVTQTATVVFDPDQVTISELQGWVRDCGYHCAGQSVPGHICDPLAEPDAHMGNAHQARTTRPRSMPGTAVITTAACRWRRWSPTCATASSWRSPSP
jgi:Cu2+-exporting ATPase